MKHFAKVVIIFILAGLCLVGCTPKETIQVMDAEKYYQNGYTANNLTAVDMFGRSFGAKSAEKTDKERYVGLFYFMTLGQHGETECLDVTKILKLENGKDLLFNPDVIDKKIAPPNHTYFWGEPLYGYYNSTDIWVIRKHMELLASAGVDFIFFDVTNAFVYESVYRSIMKVIHEMKSEGFDAPQVVFYTNAYSLNVTRQLYDNIYKKNLYPDTWFMLDGKPLIIALTSVEEDRMEAKGRGVDMKTYHPDPLSDEILNFFTFRHPQWPNVPLIEDGFPWMEWTYPAPLHRDTVSVCVAAHPALPMSFSLTRGAKNFGRGYDPKTKENSTANANKGIYFQACWDNALELDPRIVSVTGWNEWVAGLSMYDGEYSMVDLCNLEFSRDCEMVNDPDGYGDSFFLQLAANIRAYKSDSTKFTVNHEDKTIDINGDISQWDGVPAVFRDFVTNNNARNARGAVTSLKYTQAAARNNVIEVRTASDADNIYFLMTSTDPISEREAHDTTWMNILIGVGEEAKDVGFAGYEFIVNRVGADGTCSVEKLSADFTTSETGKATYVVKDNCMMVSVPKSALGMASTANAFYFKVADAIESQADILNYYVSGKSLPMGRMSFQYMG